MTMESAKRTGMIAKKIGMTQIFDEKGQVYAVTLLKADENHVLDTKTKAKDGYTAVVLGFGENKPQRVSKPLKGLCAKAGVKPVCHVKEFRVSEDALLQAGQKLSVEHFVENQRVDIQGTSIGKGFAGVMKKYHFGGQEASHGVSVAHRSAGSTGNRQDPGRTFPGKKMAGHMGDATITLQNIRVAQIDKELGIIALHGSVPGADGSYVYIKDAVKVALPFDAKYPAAIEEASVVASSEQQVVASEVEAVSENN